MVAASAGSTSTFLARKGQALIWTANLLHGGMPQNDPTLTRWSQVTHYFFDDCIYYTPAYSEEPLGRLDIRQITNIATSLHEPNSAFGRALLPGEGSGRQPRSRLARAWKSISKGWR